MLKDLLPENIFNVISKLKNQVLLTSTKEKIFVTNACIDYVLKRATEYSLYAFNNQLKQGFITAKGGIRIGVAGESVNSNNFVPTTIKNINSINIRIPHEIKDCSKKIFNHIFYKESGVKSTLIISPPGAGKTTLIRDISKKISETGENINVMIVDERFEIASVVNGEAMLDVGLFTDVVSGTNKQFAFSNGIRALKPDVIITDELMNREDVLACKTAINSGVRVIATVHADSHRSLMNKEDFKDLFKGLFFERYVIMDSKNGPGGVSQILDENFNPIYF